MRLRGVILSASLAAAWTLAAAPALAADPAADTPDSAVVRRELSQHQDSGRLTRLDSAVTPPDGLLAVGLGWRTVGAVHLLDGQLERIPATDFFLQTELTPVPGVNAWAEVPWRRWSGGVAEVPPTGSGLGDGAWRVSVALPWLPERFALAAVGGGNIPLGSAADGLGEGAFSPRLGGALTVRLMTGGQTPEMRLHLNAARLWNKAEDTGYGVGLSGFQPWPPRYPAAADVGGDDGNDALLLGAAVEFRRKATSLWLEYSQERFPDTEAVAPGEQLRMIGAGLRWGVSEGLAVHGNYLVSLARDDARTDWYPAYPDWAMSVAVSRQFGVGGRDRDGDGVVDRKDLCPDAPEDFDGFEDDDGCPEDDNDGDGVPDRYDLAPDRPEDFDGFEDEDGRPEYDNDLDGIPDRDDLCPDEPEDMDGHQDDDGCPDDFLDRDGDGVEDRKDACPDVPEDRDGFEDDDGCPEDDNDLDGIPDADDRCPDEPEDYDGDADEDGCPDVD